VLSLELKQPHLPCSNVVHGFNLTELCPKGKG
jgi:hypothetical protein